MIALEGIDQSGKRTQTRRLARRLERSGYVVKTISFPPYRSLSGGLIRQYLKGERGYSDQALHMLYSLNRWENEELVQGLLRGADFVIADRYIPSNLAYGLSKGLNLKWLLNLDEGLPKPDLVLILNVPLTSSFARKPTKRDVHEKNSKLLTHVKKSYKKLGKIFGWKMIDGKGSAKEVESAVWKVVKQRFRIAAKQD
jgi:dTMP kinase